jgi:ribosomal protein S12 methylthiotransferase accessory factor
MQSEPFRESTPANPFGLAHDLLRSAVGENVHDRAPSPAAVTDEAREAALRLLVALDYGRSAQDGRSIDIAASDSRTRDNRLALLALAARFDRAFALPMRHAPGAFFFGAMASPERFAIADHPAAGVGGRGLTFRRAFESCIGEAAEYLSFIARGNEPATANDGRGDLDASQLAWVAAGLGLEDERQLGDADWMVAQSIADRRSVRFPAELVLRRPASRRKARRETESAGVGAGPTREAATLSGLLEVIERDAIALWWHGGVPARTVGAELIDNPEFESFMSGLRGDSSRIWWLLDITTDLGVPAYAALSAEWDGRAVVAGFSAGLDAGAATRDAILEMCQMELAQEMALAKHARNGEDALSSQDRLWIARARDLSLVAAPQLLAQAPARPVNGLPIAGDPLTAIVERLRARALDAYVVDLTREDLAIPVVRVIVPGLQSTRPDWVTPRLVAAAESSGHSLDRIAEITAPI